MSIALEGPKPVDMTLPRGALENVAGVRLEIVKLSTVKTTALRLDFLGCAEGKSGILMFFLIIVRFSLLEMSEDSEEIVCFYNCCGMLAVLHCEWEISLL